MGSRRTRRAASERRARPEPLILAARRPSGAAQARPRPRSESLTADEPLGTPEPVAAPPAPRAQSERSPRAARIIATRETGADARERERVRLLSRFSASQGSSAVTRAAGDYLRAGFEFPVEQAVQLQLLEHGDESLVRSALESLARLLEGEPPLQRAVFEQRLKRLEDGADDESTRELAASLRRVLRG